MKKYVLTSKLNNISLHTLKSMGFEIISFSTNPNVDKKIAHHADLSFFVCNNDIFIAKEMKYLAEKLSLIGYNVNVIETDLGKDYPYDVKLNCVAFGDYFLCNVDYVAECVLDYMKKKGKKIINVKQGYTKCSVLTTDAGIITSDNGIIRACEKSEIECVGIAQGEITLKGKENGFIGGASGYSDGVLYFTGDVKSHPDYEKIKKFTEKNCIEILCLSNDKLADIGSIIFI